MTSIRARRSLVFPAVTIVVVGAVIAWMQATGHVARAFASPALALLALLVIACWWALGSRPGRRVANLLAVLLTFVAVGFALTKLLRYDGSADGSALPRLAWRWSHHEEPVLPDLAKVTSANASPRSDLAPPPGVVDWPQFMGLAGDGVAPAPTWQTDWKTHPPREIWRQPVGLGWSGFAVSGRRAITQEQRGDQEAVVCYDITNGEVLWAHEDRASFSESMGGDGPRATPTLDVPAGLVYTMGATGILNCFDLVTGAVHWSRNILKDAGAQNLTWAKSNSPLLHGEHVIVTGGKGGATLLAYRRGDGSPAWTGGTDDASYSTPRVMTLDGVEQIVVVNQTSVTGHDAADGSILWSFPWPGGMPKVAQPVDAGPNRLLITASYGMKCHLLELHRPSQPDRKWTHAVVWSSSAPRTKFSSASVLGDSIYGLDEGTLACVRLSDGERIWRDGRYGYGQHLLLGGTLMLIQSEPGFVALVRPDPAGLQEVARLDALKSKTWNPPALAGRWLIVRNDREAVCYELPAMAP